MYPYLTIFGHTVTTYGILIIIGFAIGALIGGKLFYMFQGLPQFLELARETGYTVLDYFNDAGLVYYGGFICAILFVFLTAKLLSAPVWGVLDTILPSIPLMQAFGRVGCFTAGCCYGIPSDFGCYFDASPVAPHGVRLLPIQLIESACVLILFFWMIRYGRKKRRPGAVLAIYLIGYGIIRFILEFFRYDAVRGIYAGLSVSQWVSLFLIALGIFFWYGYPRLQSAMQKS